MRKGLGLFIILLIIASTMLSGCTELSTLSLSGKPIPINFGYEENPSGVYDGNYWVGTAQITGDDTMYELTLPVGESDKGATTQETINIQFTGIDTKWVASLEEDTTPLMYFEMDAGDWWEVWAPYKKVQKEVPYYNIVPIGQRLNANAEVKVALPDKLIPITKKITKYDTARLVEIPAIDSKGIERTIFIKFQSIAFRGELPPSGDLSVVKTAGSQYKMVTYNELEDGINTWNNAYSFSPAYSPITAIDDWGDVYGYMAKNELIRDRSPLGTVTTITQGDNAKISIAYPTTVFAPLITIYVPEQLAETITIIEQTPGFEFDKIDKIEGVEGGSYRLTVTGTAKGTGTIELSMDSSAIKYTGWVGGAEKQIVKGEPYTFYADIEFNTGLNADKDYEATVYSLPCGLGRPTSEDFVIYLADKDIQASEKHAVRVYAIYDTTGDTVAAAPLYIGYGSDRNIGYGDSTKTGVVEGTYQVYSENITGWYPAYTADHPKTVNVEDDTKVEILFTTDEPKYDDDDDIFSMDLWLPVVAILILVGYVVMMHGGGNRILEPLRPLLSSPYFWIFMAILMVAVVGWFIYQDMSAKADNFIDAIEGVKLI